MECSNHGNIKTILPSNGGSSSISKHNFIEKEFWTSKQRQSCSLHEISYRACFKAQLPEYFINNYSKEQDVIYDPFGGRGTTAIQANLMGRNAISNDVNPLSNILAKPRCQIISLLDVEKRLQEIELDYSLKADIDISMFFHPKTEAEIISLKNQLADNDIDNWIRMIATNRLTGHSSGFFSVYTLPPNQAASAKRQIKINEKYQQQPKYRDTKKIILKKTQSLLRGINFFDKVNLRKTSVVFFNNKAEYTPEIADDSVSLTVTSPPFLDIVQYASDNWLRCWFNNIDAEEIVKNITICKKLQDWVDEISKVFKELYRITKQGGYVAFEVGEAKKIMLEQEALPQALNAGFICENIFINSQNFTKTANIWGVSNNIKGTNSNRILLLKKS